MLRSPKILCLLGLMALGTVNTVPWAEEKMDQGNCPVFWSGFNGRCYKYIPVDMTWNAAHKNCQETYDHPELLSGLVSIHSQEEHDFVLSLSPKDDPTWNGQTWIGLNDYYLDGVWTWPDGSRVYYTPWAEDEPQSSSSYNCVYTSGRQWYNNHVCNVAKHSVCVLRKATSC